MTDDPHPAPTVIDIYMNRCHMSLNLPIFFEMSYLSDIREVFKLMMVEPWRNEETFEKLQRFFPEWQRELADRVELETETLKADEERARTAKSQVACFGTMATKEMRNALKMAQGDAKRTAQRLKRAKADTERCGKIINAYNKIKVIKGE
jgi:hypothetical protein